MVDIAKRVKTERREIGLDAHARWKAFETSAAAQRGATANRDGSIPTPRIAASTPVQMDRYEVRERQRRTFESVAYRELRRAAERQIGETLDFVDLPPDEQALKAGRPVVRIITLPGRGILPEGIATGFLIAPTLILTNHHVFRDRSDVDGVGVQFLYERTGAGIREGLIFELDPDRFFVNDKALDYAIVSVKRTGIDGAPLSQFQFLPLIGAKGKIRKGDPVDIIQHPQGRPKQYATVNNHLLDLRDDGFLLYETDTLEGSSGSPVFNQHWETIGLHHCGVPQMDGGKLVTRNGDRVDPDADVDDDDLVWIANEGVRVSAIVESLSSRRLQDRDQQQILSDLLATPDPLSIVERSPLVPGSSPAPAGQPMSVPMSGTAFQFTGPVTIVVNGDGRSTLNPLSSLTPVPAVAPAPIPAIPVAPSEADFREKTLKFDEDYQGRDDHGYKPDFLEGWEVPPPSLTEDHSGAPLTDEEGRPWLIPYHHYSLVMNKARRLVAFTASNVDYSDEARAKTKTRKQYGGENWRLDPRVALKAPGLQIADSDFYAPAKRIDRGHIVRREDGAWGLTAKEAEFGNSDTYHWTNCTPQSEAFNQSGKDGIWGKFEEHIQQEAGAVGGRLNVFAGPVLNPEDPEHGYPQREKIQVPMEFWKIVLCTSEENGKSVKRAYGFVFDQTEPVQRLGYESMDMSDYKIYQMPVAEIAKKTGIAFDKSVLKADVLKGHPGNESIRGFEGRRIDKLQDVVLRT